MPIDPLQGLSSCDADALARLRRAIRIVALASPPGPPSGHGPIVAAVFAELSR